MRTLKTSLNAIMAGIVVIAILIILDENGYSYFDFIDTIMETIAF